MSATTSITSTSNALAQGQGLPSPTPTEVDNSQYGENLTYHHGLRPNPYQLLHLFNTGQYDKCICNVANSDNCLEPIVKNMMFLWAQRWLLERLTEMCSLEIANNMLFTCNYGIGLEGPIMVLSTYPYHPQLSMPPPSDPRAPSKYPNPNMFTVLN
uniref:Uncharacterized protein n=1 Tax=Moniliophthora roreri TaxID=221103 RepID=A0A0W0FHJ6_MONRR